ncbi:MAG: NAD(P)H-dependent oxidoreductase [Microscillaceae bacterium]
MKKILLIEGHPNPESYCAALAQAYRQGAEKAGAEVRVLPLRDLDFDPHLSFGYQKRKELEPDLEKAQAWIQWAEHLVWVYPTWWGVYPALMKGFIDRTFLPGFAFKYRKNSPWWDSFLKGKSARLIVTMDAPAWFFRWVYGRPGHNAMKKLTMEFCGVRPVRITSVDNVRLSKDTQRKKWLAKIQALGQKEGK